MTNALHAVPQDPAACAALDIVHRLVATPSLSGQEGSAVETFRSIARSLALQDSTDDAGNGLALRPSRGPERARIILLGHIDTVPGAIPVRIEGGILHGRGSVDAKGPLAAMLLAAARATVAPGVALEVIAAVGEESPRSPGARFLRDRRRPSACIIGEPSGWDGVTLGYKGRLRITLDIMGPCAHSAGPGPTACDLAVQWWIQVQAVLADLNRGHEGAFDTIQASLGSLGSSEDGLNQTARLAAGFRLPPWVPPAALEALLLGPTAPPGFQVNLQADGHESAHAVDRNDAVARALCEGVRRAGGRPRPKLKTGTSDLNVVAPAWRCPIAAYGPGDSSLDHTPEERLVLAEYLQSIEVLETALACLSAELADTI